MMDRLFDPAGFNEPCKICDGKGRVWDPRIGVDRMCECRSHRMPAPDVNPDAPAGIEERADEVRLNRQQALVWAYVNDGRWHTLDEIASATGMPAQSISARLRDLRKVKYGEHRVDRENLGGGLFMYRLRVNPRHKMIV